MPYNQTMNMDDIGVEATVYQEEDGTEKVVFLIYRYETNFQGRVIVRNYLTASGWHQVSDLEVIPDLLRIPKENFTYNDEHPKRRLNADYADPT